MILDEYYDEIPTWKQKENLIPEIIDTYMKLNTLLYKARFGGDGSFGLDNAQDRLWESKMWAMRDLKGVNNKDFQ